jgi:aspartate/methionine/tyrosine aminotransferase
MAELEAEGRDVLHLSGAPWWLQPEHVRQALANSAEDNMAAPSDGLPELKLALAEKLARENRIHVDPETQIVVTNGAMHGIQVIMTVLTDPGDECLTFWPGFFYYGTLDMIGTVSTYAPISQETGWAWDLGALERAITPRTRVIIVNTPQNPVGHVATEDELYAIGEIAHQHGLWVVSDEAYDRMVYDDREHISMASLPGLGDITITLCSFTKTYAMNNYRIGFIASAPELQPLFRKSVEWSLLAVNSFCQKAALAAVTGPQDWVQEIGPRFEHCRNLVCESLGEMEGLAYVKPEGNPHLFIDVSGLGMTGAEFSRHMLVEQGVPTEPGSFFGSEKHVRMAFGAEDDVVREAARRFRAGVAQVLTS